MKQLCRRRTLFGNTKETHAVFCIDRSGSLYKLWDIICTHLVEHLCKMAIYDKNAKFNVVVFDDQVESFRTKMTRVTTQSVFELKKWLQLMCHGSTSYLLPALMAAFGFTSNQCVYLVTDGLTSTESPQLFVHLPRICNGRPLHCILIKEESEVNLRAIQMMAKLTSLTCCSNSSLQVVQVNYNGALIQISPEFWCPRIPAHLYGKPEVCFTYIMDAWANLSRKEPTVCTQDAGVETDAMEGQKSLSENERNPLDLDVHDNDQNTLENNLNNQFDGQPSLLSSAFGSELPTANVKLCADANMIDAKYGAPNPVRYHQRGTTCTSDPACCLCNRSGYCTDLGSVHSCPQTERILRSRYQASRALINRWSDFDCWKDNPCYAPSAGTLLLGKLVLAPNQTKGGAMYLATVISQLTHTIFLISFEPPEVDGSQRHSVQEQRATEMISFLDYHRHPVAQGDVVLVPKSALASTPFSVDNRSNIDRDYFMEPYVLAQVIAGFEARGSVTGFNQLQEPLLIQLMSKDSQQQSEQNDQTFHVKPNAALWIPKSIVDRLGNSFLTDFRPTTNELVCSNHTCRGTTDVMVLRPANHFPTYASAGIKAPKIPAAYSTKELHLLASNCDKKEENSVKESETSLNHSDVRENSASVKMYCTDETRPIQQWTDKDVLKEDELEANRLCRQFRDACTSVDQDLEFGRMRIHWKRRTAEKSDSNRRRQWRYWGTKSIPSLLDPPTFEPYRDLPSWEKTNRYSNIVSGDVVRPEIHFTKIPQRPGRLVDFRDSTQVHMALRDPPRTEQKLLTRLPKVHRSTSDLNIHRMPVRQKSSPVCLRQTNYACPFADAFEYKLKDGHHERIVTKMVREAVNHGLHLEADNLQRMRME